MSWQLARARILRNRLNFATRAAVTALAFLTILSIQGIAISSSHSLAKYTLAKLPGADQAITLASSHLIYSESDRAKISRAVNAGLAGLVAPDIRQQVLVHALSDSHGRGFYLGGLDELATKSTLKSGRYPQSCTNTRCEVVKIVNRVNSLPVLESLKLVVVGQVILTDKLAFSGTFSPTNDFPLFLTNGVRAATSLKAVANLQGSDGWVAEININDVGRDGVTKYIKSILDFENKISSDFPRISITWPVDTLATAESDSREVARKIGSLTQVVTTLFLSFLFLFSQRQKKQDREFRAGMSRIGSPKKLILYTIFMESAAPLISGFLLCLLLSPAIQPLLSAFGFEISTSQIFLGAQGEILLLLLAFLLTVTTTLRGDSAWKTENRRLALGTFLTFAALIFINSKVLDNQNIRGWLAPLALLLISTRFSALFFDRLSFLWRSRNRSNFLIARENLGNWQALTAILTLAFLLAICSLSYASGVDQEISKKAGDKVPLDFLVATGSDLARPFDVAGISEYANLAPRSLAFPILRSGASVRGLSEVSDSIVILGLPPRAVGLLHEDNLRALGNLIAPTSPPVEEGIAMGDARVLEVDLENIPPAIDLVAWFRTPADQHRSITSVDHGSIRMISLIEQLPKGSLLVALEFHETSEYLSRRLHGLGEGKFAKSQIEGIGSVNALKLDGKTADFSKEAWGLTNFSYSFDGGSLFLKPQIKSSPPKVIVDPITASFATGGFITLSLSAEDNFRIQIAAVRKFFPSAGERFAIMDLAQLRQEISRNQMGATDPIEVWISSPARDLARLALQSTKYSNLHISDRKSYESELRNDPVNKGLKVSYLLGFLLALCFALIMHLSAIPLILRERISLLEYMEMQGSTPTAVKNSLRSSARAAMMISLLAGFLIGTPLCLAYISDSIPYLQIGGIVIAAILANEVITRITVARWDP